MSASPQRILLIAGADSAGLARALERAGTVAFDAALPASPDLILFDVDHAGEDFLEWMRRHPDYARTPVIALTCSREAQSIERLYGMGVNACLLKPLDPDSLDGLAAGIGSYAAMLSA